MMKKTKIKIVIAVAVILLLTVVICVSVFTPNRSSSTNKGNIQLEATNAEVIKNEHLDTVPDGFIGIYTIEDFDYLRNSSTGKYILMNDIDMNNVTQWKGIDFQGVFDGNNYEISNYHFENGFFDNIVNATISKLTLSVNMESTTIIREDGSWTQGVGALVNCVMTSNDSSVSSTISDCKIKGNITTNNSDFGAVAGQVKPGNASAWIKITNVVNEANIVCKNTVNGGIGGIIGTVIQQNASDDDETALEITYAVNKGNISGNCEYCKIGGIIGDGLGYTKYCDNYGNINIECPVAKDGERSKSMSSLNGTYERENTICGGIIGTNGYCTYDYGKIRLANGEIGYLQSCGNYGNIDSKNSEYAGGIIGYTAVAYSLFDCINQGSINSENSGGIQGGGYYLSGLNSCINLGSINGSNTCGAIIGEFLPNDTEPQNCYYLNNGIGSVGAKAAFPTVYALEKEEFTDQSKFNLNSDNWTFDNNGPVLLSTQENNNLQN